MNWGCKRKKELVLSDYERARKEDFESPTTTPEDKLRLGNAANDQLMQATSAKLATLPAMSAIATALLVVASFNPRLLPLTTTVKIVISGLMLIAPISLLVYVAVMHHVEHLALRLVRHVYKVPLRTSNDRLTRTFYWFVYQLPLLVAFLILLSVLVAVYVIWCPGPVSCWSL